MTGCGEASSLNTAGEVIESEVPASKVDKERDLFDFFLEAWMGQDVDELYEYLTEDIKELIGLTGFQKSILGINEVFGGIRGFSDEKRSEEAGMQICTCKAEFDNADVKLNVTICNGNMLRNLLLPQA